MIVDDATSPIFPKRSININAAGFLISNPVIIINSRLITIFNDTVRKKLKSSLPTKTLDEGLVSFSAADVSFSSSLINTRASPLDDVKNIAIHSKPESTSELTFSSPSENLIIAITIITNISSEFITYRFRISDFKSFFSISNEVRIIFLQDNTNL